MTPIKYPNLENLIRVRGIKRIAISRKLKISDRTLRNKMQGIADFTWSETTSIQRHFFPDVELEFLFAPGNENEASEKPQSHATA